MARLVSDTDLGIYITWDDTSIEIYRVLYRLDDHLPISKNDYLTIIKSIKDSFTLDSDIEYQNTRFGVPLYFLKSFCSQLLIQENMITFRVGELEFLNEPVFLDSYKKESVLQRLDNVALFGL